MATERAYHAAAIAASTAPSGCPVVDGWSPLGADYLDDPYPIASRLRADHPVFFASEIGHVVVTTMADVDEVFMSSDVYASTNVQDPIYPLAPEAAAVLAAPDFDAIAVMSNRQEPDHARIRVHTRQGFSQRRLSVLEDHIRARAEVLVDTMLGATGPVDFVDHVAFPLPAETVFRLIGFPPADDRMIKAWCVNRRAFSWGRPTAAEQTEIARGMLDYWRYCRAFVEHRRLDRADDVTSELLAAHDRDPDPSNGTGLSYLEVESIVYGISFAGHDPVTALLTNVVRCLLANRPQWDAVVADPALAAAAVEETLRFESSQISWRRVTTRDTTLAGVALPAGTKILLNLASANRDPAAFADADTFDIGRHPVARHISFGKGIHFCLGANLARLEARIVLETLAGRVPSLRLVDHQPLSFFPNITFRGPQELLVDWTR